MILVLSIEGPVLGLLVLTSAVLNCFRKGILCFKQEELKADIGQYRGEGDDEEIYNNNPYYGPEGEEKDQVTFNESLN